MHRYTCVQCQHTVETMWKPLKCARKGCLSLDVRLDTRPVVLTAIPARTTAVASSSHVAVTAVVLQGPLKTKELLISFLELFDERSVGFLAQLCKSWHAAAGIVLKSYVDKVKGFGSGSGQTMKTQMLALLANTKSLSLAVDKFTVSSALDRQGILACIVKNKIQLTLKLGTHDAQLLKNLNRAAKNPRFLYESRELGALKRDETVPKLSYQVETVTQFADLGYELLSGHVQTGLMHNKFWILDNNGIVTGSPNVSFSAMEGGNFESCIYIRSAKLAPLYQRYFKLLSIQYSEDSEAWQDFAKQVAVYNRNSTRVKAAFSPTVNISNFIVENLRGATKITVRQFLISTDGPDDNYSIVPTLCYMAKDGAEIEVFLDEATYVRYSFVRDAAQWLMECGGKVYLQTPVTVVIEEERIQHDKLILATFRSGMKRTLLGSAGATVSVIANINAENFLCLDLPTVYDELMLHHQNTLKGGTTTALWY